MQIFVKRFDELSTLELYNILKVRFKVFVMEQRCFYLDMDDIDYDAIHLFSVEDGEILSYARLFPEDEPKCWHVGRVLTLRRGEGLGNEMMKSVINEAVKNGAEELRLHAQCQAAGFYEKLGFVFSSDIFEEAGILHQEMRLKL